jgi:iron complex transport system substrate-binding protein
MNTAPLFERIACLSTEAVEVLYALGAEDCIAGISGYTTRPARARDEKPKVSGFSSAQIERILAVKPDLVIAYSNMQSEIVRELISAGIEVHAFNQHHVAGILHMIKVLAALVGKQEQGAQLIAELQAQIDVIRHQAAQWTHRPKVYFEEWNEPLMSGIGWVSELIQIAGGDDVFADLAGFHSARQRIIADQAEVVRRAPDIIIGSWCGKIPAGQCGYTRRLGCDSGCSSWAGTGNQIGRHTLAGAVGNPARTSAIACTDCGVAGLATFVCNTFVSCPGSRGLISRK